MCRMTESPHCANWVMSWHQDRCGESVVVHAKQLWPVNIVIKEAQSCGNGAEFRDAVQAGFVRWHTSGI